MLRYFKREEFNCFDCMSRRFLLLLDDIREYINTPMIIIEDYATSGHAPNSFHYLGSAVDVVFPNSDYKDVVRHIIEYTERFGIVMGIGLYPQWKYNGEVIGGLHLDNGYRRGKTTLWYRDNNGNYHYDYNIDNILREIGGE